MHAHGQPNAPPSGTAKPRQPSKPPARAAERMDDVTSASVARAPGVFGVTFDNGQELFVSIDPA